MYLLSFLKSWIMPCLLWHLYALTQCLVLCCCSANICFFFKTEWNFHFPTWVDLVQNPLSHRAVIWFHVFPSVIIPRRLLSEHAVLGKARGAQKQAASSDIPSKWHLSDQPTVQIRGLKGWGTDRYISAEGRQTTAPRWSDRTEGLGGKPLEGAPAAMGRYDACRPPRQRALS